MSGDSIIEQIAFQQVEKVFVEQFSNTALNQATD